MRTIFFLLSIIGLSSCATLQAQDSRQADLDAIADAASSFSRYVVESDLDSITLSYTEDAKLFPVGLDILEGRERIRQYWTLPADRDIISHKVTALEVELYGEEARDHGYYEGTTRMADGTESSWRGKYVIIWKKVDGRWLMYLDIWSRVDD